MFMDKNNRFQIGGYYLSKRAGSDYWYATFYDAKNRQTRKLTLGTPDLEEAKVRLAEWVVLHGDQDAPRRPQDVALADLLVRYFRSKEPEIGGTAQLRRALARFLEACDGPLKVSDLTLQRQRSIVERMRSTAVGKPGQEHGLKDGTVKKSLDACKAAVNWAWQNGELDRPLPFITVQDHAMRERVLSIEELAGFFDAATAAHMKMFLLLMIGTVARPGAVLALTREQCNFEHRFINLNPPGREQTDKRRPIVPMAPSLVPFLENRPAGPLVRYRDQAIKKINGIWRTTRAAAGLGDDVVPYTIRHTMLTELEEQGVPDTIVSAVAGHNEHSVFRGSNANAGSRTTRRYIHRRLPSLQPAADAIENTLRQIMQATRRPLDIDFE